MARATSPRAVYMGTARPAVSLAAAPLSLTSQEQQAARGRSPCPPCGPPSQKLL